MSEEQQRPLQLRCPTCGKAFVYRGVTEAERKAFPFCSERCKYADLDMWFKAEHRISSPFEKEGEDEGKIPPEAIPLDEEET